MSTIVVLNGTSSSGKTSIARAFQELAPGVFLNFSIDSILLALPQSALERIKSGAPIADLRIRNLVRAFYACVRELAELGHDLVIDHAVISAEEAEMLRSAIAGHRVLVVGLECPVEVLTDRERARGDRRLGMAAAQSPRIHQWLDYDLVLDSSAMTPDDAARRIVSVLADPLDPS